jgi:signal transduction histidine kinase
VPQWSQRYALRNPDGIAVTAEQLPLIRALAGEQLEQAQLLAYDQREQSRCLSLNAHPIRDSSGTITGAVCTVQDVTAEHHAQRYQDCKTATVLTITDEGRGIPTEDQPHLFSRLHRGSNVRHHGTPGAGLGLTLTRAVLNRHAGTITLTPAEPAGTTATIRLPATPQR